MRLQALQGAQSARPAAPKLTPATQSGAALDEAEAEAEAETEAEAEDDGRVVEFVALAVVGGK